MLWIFRTHLIQSQQYEFMRKKLIVTRKISFKTLRLTIIFRCLLGERRFDVFELK